MDARLPLNFNEQHENKNTRKILYRLDFFLVKMISLQILHTHTLVFSVVHNFRECVRVCMRNSKKNKKFAWKIIHLKMGKVSGKCVMHSHNSQHIFFSFILFLTGVDGVLGVWNGRIFRQKSIQQMNNENSGVFICALYTHCCRKLITATTYTQLKQVNNSVYTEICVVLFFSTLQVKTPRQRNKNDSVKQNSLFCFVFVAPPFFFFYHDENCHKYMTSSIFVSFFYRISKRCDELKPQHQRQQQNEMAPCKQIQYDTYVRVCTLKLARISFHLIWSVCASE